MDFLLTKSGDITFELYEKDNSPLELSFITSKTKTLSISFHVDSDESINLSNSSLQIGFYVDNPSFNKTITMASDKELYEQQINLRLKTVLGDMGSYKTLGSKLEQVKHKFIDTCVMSSDFDEEIKRSLKDIIPNCEVVTILKDDTYYGYNNCIEVYIEDKNKKTMTVYEI